MKRLFTFIIASICTLSIWAEEFTVGNLTFRTILDTEVKLVKAEKNIKTCHLTPTITYQGKTYHVTMIGQYAFWGCYNLNSVTVPSHTK